MKQVVLIAVSESDIASFQQADALLKLGVWVALPNVEECLAYANQHVRMWRLPEGLLFQDNIDQRWNEATGEVVQEVIFLSRHAAKSGQPSLTLHPIGIPHHPFGELGEYGGMGGFCPPPHPHLAKWWRLLNEKHPNDNRVVDFELSLEVTHHGPTLSSPAMFVEIGSTDATWGHVGAASFWAELLFHGLGLNSTLGEWLGSTPKMVIVTLGGGHYAPRANQLGLHPDIAIGHMLATYALPFGEESHELGLWKQSIDAALESTRRSFPTTQLVCSMDKKAFKGWQRQLIRSHLESHCIPLLSKSEIEAKLPLLQS